ncbi:MAG TPA: hypothetical protein VIW23_01875 [Candidatus Acidoferrum sp.]|jgi:small-conductance mechanosensitive channel
MEVAAKNPAAMTHPTERRILWLTPVVGIAAAGAAILFRRMDWAAGLLIGSILAWFSFKSLKQALDGLVIAFLAQGGREKPRVPLWAYALALLRYGLLALTVYGIFEFLHVPLGSMILGLCALGIATMAASVWEILASEK